MFVALVDAKSYRTAADQLFISQPALSQQIQRLERDLGFSLIDRSTRPFSLTAGGREFYLMCQGVLERVRDLEGLMDETQSGRLGRVRLGLSHSLIFGHLPSVLKAFRDTHEKVQLPITYSHTTQLLEELEGGRQDLVMLYTAPAVPGMETLEIFREPYVVVLPDDHRLAGEEEVAVAQLQGDPIIMIPRHYAPENHDAFIVACMQAGFSPRGPIAAGSYIDHVGMVSAGSGVCFIPWSLTSMTLPNVLFKPLVDPSVDATAYLCWYPERVDAVARHLIEHLHEEYRRPADPAKPWMPAHHESNRKESPT